MKLKPNLDMLPEAQKELWPLLKDTPKELRSIRWYSRRPTLWSPPINRF